VTEAAGPGTPGRVVAGFERVFGRRPDLVGAAPGRVNLIGEHTDYNEGWVLPFALGRRTFAAVAARPDPVISLSSTMVGGGRPDAVVSVALETLDQEPAAQDRPGAWWAAYPLGVVWAMRRAGLPIGGVDVHLDSEVPVGAGLSSSAALECATAVALDALFGLGSARAKLAELARRAENDFVGVPTGLMDQAVSMQAEAGRAMLLDTRNLQVRQLPFAPGTAGLSLLVVDTGVHHQLGSSGYAERRRSCEQAARLLGLRALRDVEPDRLGEALARLPDPTLRRRVRHVVTENARVLATARLLDGGDPGSVGAVLTAAHRSLRDDYEVSCAELDLVVDTALGTGALGARMIGGGFGGSAIVLVERSAVPSVASSVTDAFGWAGLAQPTIFEAEPAGGAEVVA
jgi:galactokinase